jgi:VanZ family protein
MKARTRTIRRVRLAAPLAVMGLLWVLSAMPAPPGGAPAGFVIPPWLQNLLHIPAYATLCAAWLWVFDLNDALGTPGGIAFIATLVYAFVDEWHQGWVPGRTSSLEDVLLDGVGAAAFLVCLGWFLRPTRTAGGWSWPRQSTSRPR